MFSFSSVICKAVFAICGQGLVLLLIAFQSGAALVLCWFTPGICQSYEYTKLQGALSVLFPEQLHWWVGPAIRLEACLQLSAGAMVKLMCVVFFLFAWSRSYFGVLLSPIGDACTPSFLCHFG